MTSGCSTCTVIAKCENTFTQRQALMMHMKSSHFRGDQEEDGVKEEGADVLVKRETVHECPKCGETYRKLPTLNLHMKEDHHDAEEHKGDKEQKVKEQDQKVVFQIKDNEKQNAGQEKVCEDELKNTRNKEEQKVDQHQSPESAVVVFELLVNDKATTSADDDVIQKLKQEVIKEFCKDEKKFATKNVLKTHNKEIHMNITSTCSICHKEYKALYHHMRFTHDKIKNYGCSYCRKMFLGQRILNNHVQSVHLKEKTNCPDCKKEFSINSLRMHIKVFHEGITGPSSDKIKNYECYFCKDKFLCQTLLNNHMKSVHLEEKTKCQYCKKDVRINYLRTHIKESHGGIKKPCPQCGKKFGISNQARHIRQVHNNESTKCPDCGKAIVYSNLKKHIKVVHKQLKKYCDLCNKEILYSSFSYHKRKVHKLGMILDFVTTKGPNSKLKKRKQDEFDQIKKEEIIHLDVKGEGDEEINEEDVEEENIEEEDIEEEDIDEEDIDDEDIEELELVDPTIKVTQEDSRIYRLEKQASHEWT